MSPRRLPWLVAVLASGCAPGPAPKCPDPPPAAADADPPSEAADAVVGSPPASQGPSSDPAPTPSRVGTRAVDAFPIASNCEAPLVLTQEVGRLLTAAAAHGTASAACVDGPGRRLVVNDLLVCPAAPDAGQTVVKVFYQVATYPEGDTRGCGSGRSCSWLDPSATDHLVELRFAPGADPGRGTVVMPAGPLPGFPADATPLDQVHDGNCYGKSPAFVPAEIPLSR